MWKMKHLPHSAPVENHRYSTFLTHDLMLKFYENFSIKRSYAKLVLSTGQTPNNNGHCNYLSLTGGCLVAKSKDYEKII